MSADTTATRRSVLLAGVALAGVPAGARATPAQAGPAQARLAQQPLLTPFRGVTDDPSGTGLRGEARVLGRWPADLRGRFYRNGPALFERAGQRYHHWFDGDGMVQCFTIGDGRVRHHGRLVETAKLRAERRAGRLSVPAFGTTIDKPLPLAGPDSANPANTHVVAHGGRLMALWEGGSAHAIDPATLGTVGPVTWQRDWEGAPFSAHPKVDAQGHLWNIGKSGRTLLTWHVGPDGALRQVRKFDDQPLGGMVHDMAVTRRYLVVPVPPLAPIVFGQPVPGGGPRRFAQLPGAPLRIALLDKEGETPPRWFELPPAFTFHVGNAWDAPDGSVMLSLVMHPDINFLNDAAVAYMARRWPAAHGEARLTLLRLDPKRRQARVLTAAQGDLEFPRVAPQAVGEAQRWVACAAAWRDFGSARSGLLHGWQMSDLAGERHQRCDMGEHTITEEPVWVPRPGARHERDAWLLATSFDARRQATLLNVLDAAHVERGPLAQAVLPYALPLGFHGSFVAG